MSRTIRLAAITDEYSQDIEVAARSIAETGLTGAELRSISGKNIVDLTDEEVGEVLRVLREHGLEVVSIASPLLKCVLPDAPDQDPRFERDLFGSAAGIEDQPRIAARTFERRSNIGVGSNGWVP
jgi:sugar phosphate isomerase/epimerase